MAIILLASLHLIVACSVGGGEQAEEKTDAAHPPPLVPWEIKIGPQLLSIADSIREQSIRHWRVQRDINTKKHELYAEAWDENGRFEDLASDKVQASLHRCWVLSQMALQSNNFDYDFKKKLYTELARVLTIEASNPSPFPSGSFDIPRGFFGVWYTIEGKLRSDWSDPELRPLIETIYYQGRQVARHAWTQPYKNDPPITSEMGPDIDHFRKGGHYMVANFFPYRPLFAYALFEGDDRYLEVIAKTIQRSLREPVNFPFPEEGFWTEGINLDRTVSAHGRQSYLFGYGIDYLRGVLQAAPLLASGPHALERKDFDILAEIILDGLQWFVHRGQADYSIFGRHNLYPSSGTNFNDQLIKLAEQLLNVSGGKITRGNELEQMISRLKNNNDFTGSRYFWNMEDYVHRGEGFSVVLNMNSTRTAGPENVKPWAEQNFHFGNGAMLIYQSGDEYQKTRGAWNLRAIPGITAEYLETPPPYIRTWEGIRGTEPFAGGVSDESSGVAAFISALSGENAQSRKAWFFHDNMVVTLGCDLRKHAATGPVRSNLNQTLWRGPIHIQEGHPSHANHFPEKPQENQERSRSYNGPISLWHDRIAYVIPENEVTFRAEIRNTDWLRLSELNKNRTVAHDEDVPVFYLYIDHEEGDSWYYGVHLNEDPEALANLHDNPGWKVLENSRGVQAVEFEHEKLIGAVFHQAGQISSGQISISANNSIVLLLKSDKDRGWMLTFQDPLHRHEPPQVELSIIFTSETGDHSKWDGSVDFPTGVATGKPTQIVLSPVSATLSPNE